MKYEYQEIIDKYILEEYTAEERNAFEKELSSNKELRDQYYYTLRVKSLMTDREEMKKKMLLWEQEEEQEKRVADKPQKSLIYWISGIAAIFVLGVLVIKPMFEDVSSSQKINYGGGKEMLEPMNPHRIKKSSPHEIFESKDSVLTDSVDRIKKEI